MVVVYEIFRYFIDIVMKLVVMNIGFSSQSENVNKYCKIFI